MKRNRSKRILATILCMVMVLTSNISALAEGEVLQQNAVETGTEGLEATPATVSEAPEEPAPEQPQEPASETPQGSVPEQPTSGTPEQPAPETQSGTPEQPTPGTQSETPEQPTPGTQSETPEQPTPGTQSGTPEQQTSGTSSTPEGSTPGTSSETTPQTESKDPSETPKGETPEGEKTEEETPEEEKPEEPVFSEATELHQDFKDASGKLIQRIKAKLPAGAFEAETSQITMEVSYVDSDMEKYVAGMMEEKLPEGNVLGDYMLYKIEFKVNGEVRDSLEPITITFEKSGLEITDTKKANVFYFNPKNEEEGRAKDELVEITQRNEMLEYLQSSGQSTADIEDYDLSSIEMKEENLSGKITLEGRTSTIYGCYVEKEEKPEENKEETPEEKPEALELTFEDEQVEVKVSAEEVGIIPEGATLKVVPITAENETKEQYEEVAKQIQEKVAEEEKEVAGFLAYDISFVDEDGKEVEPNGKVKVSMNYKKAELPKEVKENKATDAEVTVLHLEENEKGEVKQVVDMAAEQKATVDTLATTEGAKVQKAEVETDSFSVFTLTWLIRQAKLNITVIDVNGEGIGSDDLESININRATTVSNIAKELTIEGYEFQRAGIGRNADDALDENNEIEQLKYSSNRWQYKKAGWNSSWNRIGNQTVYFIYESTKPTDSANCYTENGEKIGNRYIDLQNITERDNLAEMAIEIRGYEFLYVTVVEEDESPVVKRLRMTEHGLQYSKSEDGDSWEDVSGNQIRFVYRAINGEYATIKTVDTAGLIDINLYDYAENANYNGLIFNGGTGAKYNQWIGYWDKEYGYESGNDSYAVQGIMDRNLYTASGKPVTEDDNYQGYPKVRVGENQGVATKLLSDPVASELNHLFTKDQDGYYEYNSAYNYAYYKTEGNPQKNFLVYNKPKDRGQDGNGDFMPLKSLDENDDWYYGMTVGFNFIQPEGGLVNGKHMKFEFSGDDDVWVFVDGRLVLDIGGIHGAVGGTIDFNTGDVQVENVVSTRHSGIGNTIGRKTTLKKIFDLSGNTFEDYTEHRVEFIYFERGAGESNCHLRFNMPPIPKDSLQVRKEITNTDKEKYANVEFSFEVWLEAEEYSQGCEQVGGTWYKKLPDGTSYAIYKNETPTGRYGTIENGIFKLKHGETAVFEGIKRNLKYYAVEKEVSSDEFDKVEIPRWDVSYEDEYGNDIPGLGGVVTPGQKFIAKSEPKRVGGNSVIVFQNRCSTANKRELWITKKMAEGQTADSEETFSFKVFLEGTDGKLVQYGAGNEYYVVEGNEATEELTPKRVPADGIIRDIKPGQSVVLTQILSGTEFRVEEVELDDTVYYNPQKEVDTKTCGAGTIKDENGNVISDGTIELMKDAKVTITNKKRVNTFHIKKVDAEDETVLLPEAKFKLEKQDGYKWKIVDDSLTTDDNGMITVSGLENGTYRITEIAAPEGYIILEEQPYTFSLPYSKSTDNSVIVEAESKLPDGSYGEITKVIKNQKKDWEIYKRSSSDDNLFIGEAEFELKSKETSEEGNKPIIYYGLSSSDENQKGKIIWYTSKEDYSKQNSIDVSQMKAGEYSFKETKAPNGYSLNSEEWTIKLGNKGALLEVSGNTVEETQSNDGTEVTYYFENTPLYALPSTGGSGIFVYTIGGTLLLMAAALLIYKMKREEVLKR